MYKSMTVDEIMQRPDSESLGGIEELTMFYDPATDEIILNSDYELFDLLQKLVEKYLTVSDDRKERIKKAECFYGEIDLLDKVIDIRQSKQIVQAEKNKEELKKQYAEELKMIGNQTVFWQQKEFIGVLELITDSSVHWKMINAFDWGYILGIRAERARRKKHVQREGLGA